MTMAIAFSSYGGPEVLTPIDAGDQQPATGQVRVRVRAAGVQPFDCLFRSGAAHQWMPASFPQRLGNEFAGVIDAVADDVATFSMGDEVLGWAMLASYAEHVVVGSEQIVAKPEGMAWADAGVLAASGQTAHTALQELGVGPGDTVLIHAAAGGVGTFAVQLARARGAKVVGTASEANHDYLRSLGAAPVAYGDGLADQSAPSPPTASLPPWTPPGAPRRCPTPFSLSAIRPASPPSPSTRPPTNSACAA